MQRLIASLMSAPSVEFDMTRESLDVGFQYVQAPKEVWTCNGMCGAIWQFSFVSCVSRFCGICFVFLTDCAFCFVRESYLHPAEQSLPAVDLCLVQILSRSLALCSGHHKQFVVHAPRSSDKRRVVGRRRYLACPGRMLPANVRLAVPLPPHSPLPSRIISKIYL